MVQLVKFSVILHGRQTSLLEVQKILLLLLAYASRKVATEEHLLKVLPGDLGGSIIFLLHLPLSLDLAL